MPEILTWTEAKKLASDRGFKLIARLGALEEAITKLNRKAEKLGLPPLALTRGEERLIGVPADEGQPPISIDGSFNPGRPPRPAEVVTRYEVRLEGQRVIIEGWEVVAAVESVEDKDGKRVLFVHAREGADIPARYWDATRQQSYAECEHCQMNRQRHNAYIVKHVQTGEYKQVGSTCMRDFTGHKSPEALLAWAENVRTFDLGEYEDDDGPGGYGWRPPRAWETLDFLALVHAYKQKFGWVSRKRIEQEGLGGQATVDQVLFHLTAPADQFGKAERDGRIVLATQADKDAAQRVMTEVLGKLEAKLGRMSDFEHNLYVALQAGVVTARAAGVVSALFAVQEQYRTREEREAEEAARAARSKHVGVVGERLTLKLKFLESRAVRTKDHTGFGEETRHVLNFEDADGNVFTIWASEGDKVLVEKPSDANWKGVHRPLVAGEEYLVRATVKQHGVFRSRQETTLNRADFTAKLPEAEAAEKAARKKAKVDAEKAEAAKWGVTLAEYRKRKKAGDEVQVEEWPIRHEVEQDYYAMTSAHLEGPDHVRPYADRPWFTGPIDVENCPGCKKLIEEVGWYNDFVGPTTAQRVAAALAKRERIMRDGLWVEEEERDVEAAIVKEVHDAVEQATLDIHLLSNPPKSIHGSLPASTRTLPPRRFAPQPTEQSS